MEFLLGLSLGVIATLVVCMEMLVLNARRRFGEYENKIKQLHRDIKVVQDNSSFFHSKWCEEQNETLNLRNRLESIISG